MYWAGTGARRFPWPDDRRDPIRPVGSRLWETRSDSSGSVLAQFELTRLAIPYEFRFEEEAADDERLSEIWDM